MSLEFFLDNAGYSYGPEPDTPEAGQFRTAATLSRAERAAKEADLEFAWFEDWEIDHAKEYEIYDDGEPETCEICVCRSAIDHSVVLASLSCIDDATPAYRRVIEAELALEVLPMVGIGVES